MLRLLGDRRLWVGVLLVAALVTGWTGTRTPAIGQEAQPLPAGAAAGTAPLDDTHQLIGTASCAASNCHGGNKPAGEKGSEYTTWVTVDPHAGAFVILFDRRSREIARNLSLPTPAHQAQVCLDCHATKPAAPAIAGPGFDLTFGVGCESCHGAAEKWVDSHVTRNWQEGKVTAAEKKAQGFVETRDLVTRARVCMDCHIGASDREVNHDLIAAGHPRLNFDFGAYHARLPKHWRERKGPSDRHEMDKDLYPDFEARAWAVGQVVAAEAALKLLANRSGSEQPAAKLEKMLVSIRPWPEFTEYDCFACHHDLQVGTAGTEITPSWRQARWQGELAFPETSRGRGILPWGNWQFALLPLALGPQPTQEPPAWLTTVQEVQTLMGTAPSYQPGARAKVHAAALAGQKAIAAHLAQPAMKPLDAAQVRGWIGSVASHPQAAETWDQAAQTLLALQALDHALADMAPAERTPARREALNALLETLQFPTGEANFDSPRNYDPTATRAALEQVRTAWGE